MINSYKISKSKASEIIRSKLIENNGKATIRSLIGKEYEISITKDNERFYCYDLPESQCEYRIFDVIVEFLLSKRGKAKKGNGRKNKLGDENCDLDTVVGIIGYKYSHKNTGESIHDPLFVLAAVLEWAGICNNERGYLELKEIL